ncbi:MAG: mechanosensitive ion channel family protein [Vicinamibacteria bacterium]
MENFLTPELLFSVIRAGVTLIIGFVLAQILRSAIGPLLDRKASPQHAMLGKRLVFYPVIVLAAASALRELGFDFTVLLGAAGIVTVAMGFAAQTSAANLISGIFLMTEGPFVIGEVIEVAGTTGEVLSIDLLSVKLCTPDNLFVRVPNETLVKAQITNLTRHPIRRYDMQVGVAYASKIGRVREILLEVAHQNPLSLREPKPIIIFLGYGESAVNLQFSVWAARDNYLELLNSIAEQVKEAFEREGIEIPYPHRSLEAGDPSKPIQVSLVPAPATGGGQ